MNRDQYIFDNDANIRNMWLEQAYWDPANQTIKDSEIGWDQVHVRIFTHNNKPTYQVAVRANYQTETYNLNQKSRRSNFSKWFMETQADLQLSRLNYKFTYHFDSKWNLGVLYYENELFMMRLYYNDTHYYERIKPEFKSLGSLKGGYTEVSFAGKKWQKVKN